MQMRDKYTAIDTLTMRQQLGEISHDELNEVNRVMGSTSVRFTKSANLPAKLIAEDVLTTSLFFVAGMSFFLYGRFALKSNMLWLLAAPAPALVYAKLSGSREDTDLLQNAYRYLLTKRAATAEFEQNQASVPRNEKLADALSQTNCTLYEMEQQLVAKIAESKFWTT